MTEENIKENLSKKYDDLPEDVRNSIFSVDSNSTVEEIAKKYKLSIDESGKLADEVGLLMLGITHPKDFITNISRRLGVEESEAREITVEVNKNIFSKVRESLKKIHDIKEDDSVKDATPSLANPVNGINGVNVEEDKLEERHEILHAIENPEKISVKKTIPGIIKLDSNLSSEDEDSDGLHRRPPETTEHKLPVPIAGSNKYTDSDPYREQIN